MLICDYILLAEFDIDEGSVLRHEYPLPTGCDGHLLAELMLPDGAHLRTEDWTVFYLNQTKATTVKRDLQNENNQQEELNASHSSSSPSTSRPDNVQGNLLYAISLVRTKHGSAFKRGALVKALAICSSQPSIQIFKPVLLLALEDYFNEPTPTVLKRLYDSINAIDFTMTPEMSLDERLVLRQSERKDLFEEKFFSAEEWGNSSRLGGLGNESIRHSEKRSISPLAPSYHQAGEPASSVESLASQRMRNLNLSSGVDSSNRTRAAADIYPNNGFSSASQSVTGATSMQRRGSSFSAYTVRSKGLRDTHYYDTSVIYNGLTLPIRLPLGTFPEEVGDYSLITLIQTFSNFTGTLGPLHPHLHPNGSLTPPIIVLLNALLTYKRVLFLGGSGQPASQVTNVVLSACALGSGCGQFFGSSFVERAFPYSNLTNLENVLAVPGYIAGVSNPRFEDLTSTWDVLCNIETGRIHISKDIQQTPSSGNSSSYPSSSAASILSFSTSSVATHSTHANNTSGDLSMSASPEPLSALSGTMPFGQYGAGIQSLSSSHGDRTRDRDDASTNADSSSRMKMDGKVDSADNTFMDEIISAIHSHFGEAVIRGRFVEYVRRFVRLASRYEEDTIGFTSIDFPSVPYASGRLGSGLVHANGLAEEVKRELSANAGRIEGWRRTKAYEIYKEAWLRSQQIRLRPIQEIDLHHQIARLRFGKKLSTDEVEAIMKRLKEGVRSDEQIVELLSHLPSHLGGLLPVAFGLFHPSAVVRHYTVELLNTLYAHPTATKFLQSLNAFHRLAYSRLAHGQASSELHRRQTSSGNMNGSIFPAKDKETPLPPIPISA